MEAPETQGKRTVFMILVSSCVFFSAAHIEDDEQDEESQQTSAEDEEVLSLQTLELDRTADTLVYRVFSHTLFIKGRMSAG